MDLTDLATRAEPTEALAWLEAVEGVTDAELVALDDVPADQWLARHVHDPDLVDLVRYGAVAMCTLPRLEDMAASTVVAAMRIVQTMPRADKDIDGWILLRDASRPGDKGERLRLYRRAG